MSSSKNCGCSKKQFILSAAPESHLEAYTHENGLKKFFSQILSLIQTKLQIVNGDVEAVLENMD